MYSTESGVKSGAACTTQIGFMFDPIFKGNGFSNCVCAPEIKVSFGGSTSVIYKLSRYSVPVFVIVGSIKNGFGS